MTAELGRPPPATHGTSAPASDRPSPATVDAGDEDGWSLIGAISRADVADLPFIQDDGSADV